jgi:predicted nucleic acid-binding protein
VRIVIDTSVLVSAAIRDRLPERVLLWCVAQPELEWLVT